MILGLASIVWAALTFPYARDQFLLDGVARNITAGQSYNSHDLLARMPLINRAEHREFCNAALAQDAVVVRLSLIEDAARARELPDAERSLDQFIASTRKALKCVPSDPFLWLVLYSAERSRYGNQPRVLEFMRLSYRLGPNEGWIALKRNPMALEIFDKLPPDLKKSAMNEFASLVNSWFFREAGEILRGAGWSVRDQLAQSLKHIPLRKRIDFQQHLREMGLPLEIPGVVKEEPRPWN